jgi:hypothetical protein
MNPRSFHRDPNSADDLAQTAMADFDAPNAKLASVRADLARELQAYLDLGREFLALFTEENQALRRPQPWSPTGFNEQRKRLLPRLESGLIKVRSFRLGWERMPAGQRESCVDIKDLFRDIQNLVPRLLMLDRENQQELLRRGLIPATQLPPAASQRPNFVASIYRRHAAV